MACASGNHLQVLSVDCGGEEKDMWGAAGTGNRIKRLREERAGATASAQEGQRSP